PLSMILGYASELEDQSELSAEHKQQAAIIRRQGERLRSLVSDLNLVSMLEYDMQPLQLKSIRLSALARQVVSDFLNNGLIPRMTRVPISTETNSARATLHNSNNKIRTGRDLSHSTKKSI
ncbi:hypothetical protein GNF82_21235, partial [Clostridium perfringens]